LGDDTIFNENRSGLFVVWGIKQSAIGYKQFLRHIAFSLFRDYQIFPNSTGKQTSG